MAIQAYYNSQLCAYSLRCGYSGFSVATIVASEEILLDTTGLRDSPLDHLIHTNIFFRFGVLLLSRIWWHGNMHRMFSSILLSKSQKVPVIGLENSQGEMYEPLNLFMFAIKVILKNDFFLNIDVFRMKWERKRKAAIGKNPSISMLNWEICYFLL
jgi:hypothetical protein